MSAGARGAARRTARGLSLAMALLALAAILASPAWARGEWLRTANLSASGQNAVAPEVAVDPGEDAFAVWRRFDGANYVVEASKKPAGGSWSSPVALSAPGGSAGNPQIAVGPTGNAVAIWARTSGLDRIVQAAAMPAGGSWGPAVDLSPSGFTSEAPQVGIDGSGRTTAIWTRATSGSTAVVETASLPLGGSWGPTQPLNAGGRGDEPQIAVDPAGEAIAVWREYELAPTVIDAATMAPGGSWSAAAPISAAGASADQPQVAIDAAGAAVATWRREQGGSEVIEAANRSGGSWSPATALSAGGANSLAPQVAIDGSGAAVAAWTRESGPFAQTVQAATMSAGGSWGTAVPISKEGDRAETPQVAFDPTGTAVLLWSGSDSTPTVVHLAELPPGGSWGSQRLLSEVGGNSLEAQLAIDPEGNRVAVWSRFDGSDYVIQALGFDGAPPRIAGLSVPAAGTVTRPIQFSASPYDAWSPLRSVEWTFGDGGSASGPQVSHAFTRPGVYPVTVSATDVLGFSSSAGATITIFPKPSAAHFARVRGGRALLRLHNPSTASADGEVRLIAGFKVKRGTRTVGKRRSIGKRAFDIAPKALSTIAVPLTHKGLLLVRASGSKGVKAQLTGPGVKHRIVILLGAGAHHRRHHRHHHR